MKTPRNVLLLGFALTALTSAFADQNLAGNVTITGGATGNLFVTGYIDSDNNQFTFGTESTSYGARLLYATGSVPTGANDTLQFLVNRSPASWVWTKNTGTVASPTLTNIMRLDDANRLLLYQSNGTTAGLTLTPASNQISLGTATLTGSGTALTTGGALNVSGNFANTGAGNTNSFLGSLGVGTASPANKLHVYGSTGEVALTVDSNGYAPVSLWARNDLDPALYWKANFRMRFGTTTNGISSTGWTERMTILSNGNVGIATQTPGTPLDVLKATGDAIQIKTADTNPSRLDIGTNGTAWYTTASRTGTGSFLPLTFWTSDSERMRIDTTGNVGIGTNGPAVKLDVTSTATGDVEIARFLNPNIATGNYGYINVGGTDSQGSGAFLGFQKTGTNTGTVALGVRGSGAPISINELGNVGIGAATPNYALSFGPTLGKVLALYESNGTNLYGFSAAGSGTGADPYRTRIFANGNETMSLTSASQVGIGTAAPYAKLAVVGNISAGSAATAAVGTNTATLTASSTKSQLYLIRSVGAWSDTWWEWTHDNDNKLKLGFSSVPQAEFANGQASFLGNVGIGTTSPGSKLQVSAIDPLVRIHNTNDTGGAFVGDTYGVTQIGRFNPTGGQYGAIGPGLTRSMLGMDANGRVGTLTNNFGSPAWRNILDDGNGNVGLGTTTPQARLQLGAYFDGTGEATNHGDLLFSKQNTSLAATGGIEWKIASDNYGAKIDTISAGGANLVFGLRNNSATWTESMRINPAGNVGIGTTAPTGKLEISQVNAAGWNGNLKAARIVSPDTSYYLDLNSYIIGAGNVGYHFSPNGNTGLVISTTGNVGIGTTAPTHKLAVNGTIRAKEIIVDNTNWADYVFADSYRLAPLAEVEQHIKANKHLPGIPSAAEIAEKGVSMGDMQAKLLSKVEELTLHLIRLEKENNELRQRMQKLETATANQP